ncbi:hypothetical protein HGM15179_017047 [Zosterops borbonicus]|uniref:Uncharacterized protein n=1 Tax=Zosterops borbonicus TaxID=364589 RepID=A0A8K1G1V0_9PASS|nr:hypothetical protein HGM15179_017047 [Zosterops borbonicus]
MAWMGRGGKTAECPEIDVGMEPFRAESLQIPKKWEFGMENTGRGSVGRWERERSWSKVMDVPRFAGAAPGSLGMSKARLDPPGTVGGVPEHGWGGNGMGFKVPSHPKPFQDSSESTGISIARCDPVCSPKSSPRIQDPNASLQCPIPLSKIQFLNPNSNPALQNPIPLSNVQSHSPKSIS